MARQHRARAPARAPSPWATTERSLALAAAGALEADVAGVDLLVAPDGETVVLEVNGIPGWQALQSVCEQDSPGGWSSACEALVTA